MSGPGADDELRLWLIRHAPVDGPRGVIHAPEAPADLSAGEMIATLRGLLPAGAAAHVSPARRTRETAAALGLDAVLAPAFREQDFGAWTGRRHAELQAEAPEAYAAFWTRADIHAPPGGESFVDQIARVRDGLAALPPGDQVLVVHSGTIRAVLALVLDIAPLAALRLVVDPLSLTRIDRLAGGWRVNFVNRLPGPPPWP
jgi:alpha-ribazole phosphatase